MSLIAVVPGAIHAQQRTVIAGVVRSARDTTAKAGVVVRAPLLGLSAVTDSAGRFTISGLPASSVFLEIRRVGIQALDTIVDAPAASLDVRVSESAVELDTVAVSASGRGKDSLPGALTTFETRRARGGGNYVTDRELRQNEDRDFVEVLRSMMPGIAFEHDVDGVHAYNPSMQPPGALRETNRNAGGKCYVQVVLDGVSIYELRHEVDAGVKPPDLSQYLTRTLGGVEYYSTPSRVPPELRTGGSTCGVLVLWTRRR